MHILIIIIQLTFLNACEIYNVVYNQGQRVV